jgi:hypothetical protein
MRRLWQIGQTHFTPLSLGTEARQNGPDVAAPDTQVPFTYACRRD